MNCSTDGAGGSVPQPLQQFSAVDSLILQAPVGCPELRAQGVHLCCLHGNVPGHAIVKGIGAIPQDVLKGGAGSVHVEAVAEGGESSGHRIGCRWN